MSDIDSIQRTLRVLGWQWHKLFIFLQIRFTRVLILIAFYILSHLAY